MPSTTCPGCGRNRNVRRDGCFVVHPSPDTRARCPFAETSAAVPFAEAALRLAEHRARVSIKHAAAGEHRRAVAEACEAEVAKARAALDALRVLS